MAILLGSYHDLRARLQRPNPVSIANGDSFGELPWQFWTAAAGTAMFQSRMAILLGSYVALLSEKAEFDLFQSRMAILLGSYNVEAAFKQ